MKASTPTLFSTLALGLLFVASCSGEPLDARVIQMTIGHEGPATFAPMDATGEVTIDTATGEVVIVVHGLPTLANDEYEGWLTGGGESPVSTGKFNTDASGVGGSSIVLGDLRERTFARVVLTVEPVPDPSPGPDARHSLGGDIPAAQ